MAKTYLQTKLTGTAGQVVGFNASGNAEAQNFSGGFAPRILYTAASGLTVTATKGSTVVTASYSGGQYIMNIPEFGTWITSNGSKTGTVVVSEVTDYDAGIIGDLKDTSWALIRQVSDEGKAASYWNVGDMHPITLTGTLSEGLTMSGSEALNVFIIGFDHNISAEGNGNTHTITFQGFKDANGKNLALVDSGYNSKKTSDKWFNMNNSNDNTGGWKSSSMKTNIMSNIESAMPSDLKAVLKTVNKFSGKGGGSDTAGVDTTTEKVFLLAEKEIFNSRQYSQSDEANQNVTYTYWANHSSSADRVFYRHNSTDSTCFWWGRSPHYNNVTFFYRVGIGGGADFNMAAVPCGVAPVFNV